MFAVVSLLAAVQLRFGDNAIKAYFVLSLALTMLWLVAAWIAGGCNSRFIGTDSDDLRKVLNAAISRPAEVALLAVADG
jgi:hypothetical protein